VHREGAGALGGIVNLVQKGEQALMELRDAVEFECGGCALEGEAAQDVGGQVAAVDRQARIAR
jgi:hypothetical protein